jgi:mono/diheme cytochrome c family protein
MKKKILTGIIAIAAAGTITSCSHDRSPASSSYDPNDPGYEYNVTGDMYHSIPYDPQTQYEDNGNPYNPDSMTMRLPVVGTVPHGHADYYFPYKNTPAEYERAGKELTNPVPNSAATLVEGKRLFEIYCWHCHGKEGKSDGPVMASGKFPKPGFGVYQSDYIRQLPEGKMFFTITYGKNLMGPHAPMLTPTQRWTIIHYIKYLANQGGSSSGTSASGSDSTKTSPAATETNTKAKS